MKDKLEEKPVQTRFFSIFGILWVGHHWWDTDMFDMYDWLVFYKRYWFYFIIVYCLYSIFYLSTGPMKNFYATAQAEHLTGRKLLSFSAPETLRNELVNRNTVKMLSSEWLFQEIVSSLMLRKLSALYKPRRNPAFPWWVNLATALHIKQDYFPFLSEYRIDGDSMLPSLFQWTLKQSDPDNAPNRLVIDRPWNLFQPNYVGLYKNFVFFATETGNEQCAGLFFVDVLDRVEHDDSKTSLKKFGYIAKNHPEFHDIREALQGHNVVRTWEHTIQLDAVNSFTGSLSINGSRASTISWKSPRLIVLPDHSYGIIKITNDKSLVVDTYDINNTLKDSRVVFNLQNTDYIPLAVDSSRNGNFIVCYLERKDDARFVFVFDKFWNPLDQFSVNGYLGMDIFGNIIYFKYKYNGDNGYYVTILSTHANFEDIDGNDSYLTPNLSDEKRIILKSFPNMKTTITKKEDVKATLLSSAILSKDILEKLHSKYEQIPVIGIATLEGYKTIKYDLDEIIADYAKDKVIVLNPSEFVVLKKYILFQMIKHILPKLVELQGSVFSNSMWDLMSLELYLKEIRGDQKHIQTYFVDRRYETNLLPEEVREILNFVA